MKKFLLFLMLVSVAGIINIYSQLSPVITQVDTFAIKGLPAQPVLKIYINTGEASYFTVDKLAVKSLCQDITDVDSVAVYLTSIDRFSLADYPTEAKLIAKRKKITGDSVVFTCNNYPLAAGSNFIWVVMDVSRNAREFRTLDASIRAGGITISGLNYPYSLQSPTGNVIIRAKYFTENFESYILQGGKPEPVNWTQVLSTGSTARWQSQKGGYGVPDNPGSRNPNFPKSGGRNARLARETIIPMETWLVSKPIDLSLSVKPLLTFYHAQMSWCIFENCKTDNLAVYYKLGSTGTWKILKNYTLPTPDDGSWIKRDILLPAEASNSAVYLGFKGTAQYGWGTCLDSVVVYETATVPREIKSVVTTHTLTSFVPQGTIKNPILRTNIRIRGNMGNITLNSFSATSLNTSNNDIPAGGVKLYYTSDSVFKSPILLGTGQTFSANKVTFSGLNRILETGENYFWITYDINANATSGNFLDASIQAGDIMVSGVTGTFPSVTQSPAGQRIIKQNVFFDDFETNKGWGLRGEFQIGQPIGQGGGDLSFADPTEAYANTMVLGTDLTGTGANPGNYEPNLSYATADTATSPLIQAKYFKNTQFSFARWLNIDVQDSAVLEYKYAGESKWRFLWKNTGYQTDDSWKNVVFDTRQIFDRKNFRIRFRLGPTSSIINYSGWNIDYLFITGDSIRYDAALTQLINPKSTCGLTSSEHFKVRIKNAGPKALTNIPVKFSTDNGLHWITENIAGPLAVNDSMDYTFTSATDLSKKAIYHVILKVALPLDDYRNNDSIVYMLTSVPSYTIPYRTGFEQDTSLWVTGGLKTSWTHGAPNGYFIYNTVEGTKCWKTDTAGRHNMYEYSYLESPCFNFTGISRPLIDLKYSHETAMKIDGAIMEYSLDKGNTWNYLPEDTFSFDWPWYNDSIIALSDKKGWTGQTMYASEQIWVRGKQVLPSAIANKNDVRFRFVFKSDSSTNTLYDGFAFDDFRLHNASFDVGVTSVNNIPALTCSGSNPDLLNVTIKNYGIRNMAVNDTMIVGIKINDNPAVVDTLKLTTGLNTGESQQYTLHKPVNLKLPGTYKVSVFTLSEKDPFYYSSVCNDSVTINATVQDVPFAGLRDTIYSAALDTLKIQAFIVSGFQYAWVYPKTGYTHNTSLLEVKNTGKGWHYLTITNPSSGCQTYDSIYVDQLVRDVSITNVIAPVTHCAYGNNFQPIIKIKNAGTDTLRVNQIIPVTLKLNAGSELFDQIVLNRTLKPDSFYTVTLLNTLNLATPGNYQLTMSTRLSNDTAYSNDTIKTSFVLHSYPSINLGSDLDINGDSYTLDAGSGFSTYQWNDSSTNRTLFVNQVGNYSVTVTNSNGCADSDTIYIHLKIHDMGIKRIISPVNTCSLLPDTAIYCAIMNYGSENIATTETITMSYSLDGSAFKDSTFNLQQALLPGDSIIFKFRERINLGTKKDYPLSVVCHLAANDLRSNNDTVKRTVSMFGKLNIDLGRDSIVNALQYNLTPGTGFASYMWQDSSSNPNYLTTRTHNELSGKYKVNVTSINGCAASDSVKIILDIKDLGITALYLPSASCVMSATEAISLKITNLGDSAFVNKPVTMSYKVNNNTPVSETLYFTGIPGEDSTYTFVQTIDLSAAGSYKFNISLQTASDVQPNNDTISQTVFVTGLPPIIFAGTLNDTLVTDLPHTLDAGTGVGYSYLWSTGATTQTLNVDTSGLYSVTVTNLGACGNTKEVMVIKKMPDLELSGFSVPLSGCTLPANQTIGVEVTNKGNNILNDQPFTIHYQLNGNTEKTKVVTFTGGRNQKNTFVFNETEDLSVAGIYEFVAGLRFSEDVDTSNNTKNYTVVVHGMPVIDLGGINDTLQVDLPYTLDAGAGIGKTYLWNNGIKTQTIDVYNPDWYEVTVTNAGSCKSKDSVYIIENTLDMGITGYSMPLTNCASPGNLQTVGVEITNTGNLNIENQFVTLRYQINGGIVWTKSVLFSGAPGSKSTFTFDEPADFSLSGTYLFALSLTSIGDGISSNNSGSYSVEVNDYPEVNFGAANDTLKITFPYTLDAGAGTGYLYSWNTGATTQTIEAAVAGWYTVTVTNPGGCSTKDSVYVYEPKILDLGISGFTVPLSACILPTNQAIGIELTNYGYVLADQPVTIKYQINGGTERTKSVLFTGPLNTKTTYTFDDLADLSVKGIYRFKVSLVCEGDIIMLNDTVTYTVNVHGFPTPNIGENRSVNAFTHTLDPGNGYVNYKWQDNSTDSVYIITKDHYEQALRYQVTVTDVYGCQGTSASTIIVLLVDDVEISNIQLSNQLCSLTANEQITVGVINSGNVLIGNNRIVKLKYQINGGEYSKIDTLVFTKEFYPNISLTHTFKQPANLANSSDYKLTVYVSYDLDVNHPNDSLSLFIKGAPIINFGGINDTLRVPLPYTLDAGAGDGYQYIWNTGATAQTLNVLTSGLYSVTVTNSSGCTSQKSVYMLDMLTDLAITDFTVPLTSCKLAANQQAGIEISNLGVTQLSNEPLSMRLKLNDGSEITKNITFTGSQGSKAVYNFDETFDLSAGGNYQFLINLNYPDKDISNNTKYYQVVVFGEPVVNLGGVNDTLKVVSFPDTLDAGSGYKTYQWQNNSTSQTLEVTDEGWYSVTVTNESNCSGTTRVYVMKTIGIHSLKANIDILVHPNPVQDVLNIHLKTNTRDNTILEIITTEGKVMLTKILTGHNEYSEKIDVSSFPQGIYFIKIHNNKGYKTYRIIVQ